MMVPGHRARVLWCFSYALGPPRFVVPSAVSRARRPRLAPFAAVFKTFLIPTFLQSSLHSELARRAFQAAGLQGGEWTHLFICNTWLFPWPYPPCDTGYDDGFNCSVPMPGLPPIRARRGSSTAPRCTSRCAARSPAFSARRLRGTCPLLVTISCRQGRGPRDVQSRPASVCPAEQAHGRQPAAPGQGSRERSNESRVADRGSAGAAAPAALRGSRATTTPAPGRTHSRTVRSRRRRTGGGCRRSCGCAEGDPGRARRWGDGRGRGASEGAELWGCSRQGRGAGAVARAGGVREPGSWRRSRRWAQGRGGAWEGRPWPVGRWGWRDSRPRPSVPLLPGVAS